MHRRRFAFCNAHFRRFAREARGDLATFSQRNGCIFDAFCPDKKVGTAIAATGR
jgi:hypothetical protein